MPTEKLVKLNNVYKRILPTYIFRIRLYLETSLIFQRAEELPLANELESDDQYGTGGGRSHTVKTDFRSIKSRSCLLRTPRLSLASEITHHLFVSGSGLLYLTLVKIDKREE